MKTKLNRSYTEIGFQSFCSFFYSGWHNVLIFDFSATLSHQDLQFSTNSTERLSVLVRCLFWKTAQTNMFFQPVVFFIPFDMYIVWLYGSEKSMEWKIYLSCIRCCDVITSSSEVRNSLRQARMLQLWTNTARKCTKSVIIECKQASYIGIVLRQTNEF